MRGQVKYFATSTGIHMVLLALLLAASANAVVRSRPITLDFTLNSCPVPELPPELPKQRKEPRQQTSPPPLPQQAAQKPAAVEQASAPPVQHAAPTPTAPAPARVVDETPRYSAPPMHNPPPAPVAHTAPAHRPAGDERMTPEKAQQKYLKEHFAYIRDLIIKKLSYPSVARRMGWSGRVVLAFVVKEDGTIGTLKVRESSGYNALDNSAVDTVRNVAPFPKPPVAAEIIMPVQFLLD